MRTGMRFWLAIGLLALSAGAARAEEAAPADAAKAAAMDKMQQLTTPGEAHKALEPLAGTWTWTGTFTMAPGEPPETMTGTTTNTLIFGGRFLKQEVRGTSANWPNFQGLGFLGYDNVRKEYQSVWLDGMNTAIMTATGPYSAGKAIELKGDFSCPMTGDPHRQMRDVWRIVDPDHTVYESYSKAPDSSEFKSMEIHYTRVN